MNKTKFESFWLTEIIRHQEAHLGPFADSAAMRRASSESNLTKRLFIRTEVLAGEHDFKEAQLSCQRLLKLGQLGLIVVAILSGIGLALNLSPQTIRTISIIEALIAIIVVNGLLILLWAVSVNIRQKPGGIGALLGHYSSYLARGKNRLNAMQAFNSVAARGHLFKPALSALTHGFWLLLLGSAFITLTFRFIGYDYQFIWQTTLLSEANVEQLVRILHIVPGLLSIEPPMVSFAEPASFSGERQTALWLLTCMLCYAILPRLVLFITCEALRRYRLKHLSVDWNLPGFSELYSIWRTSTSAVTDPAPDNIEVIRSGLTTQPNTKTQFQPEAWFTLECGEQMPTHPALQDLSSCPYLGDIGTREQRVNLLQTLQEESVSVLAVINPELSVDRGSLRFLAEVERVAQLAVSVVLKPDHPRASTWKQQISERLPAVPVYENLYE